MPETYIPLADAAQFESVSYDTLKKRIQRNPEQYKTQTVAGEGGGKDQIRVAVSSLSQKARRAHRAQQRIDGGDIIIDQIKGQETPWYVTADLNQYIEGHKRQYYEAVELANRVQESLQYDGPDRTGYMKELAEELGIGTATLYRHQKAVAEANAWAERLRREDGFGRSHFRVLAVCRKPKERNTFPGLTPEQRALIENIWFDKRFRNNHGSMVLLWERFEIEAEKRGWTDYPGQKTIERYINYIKELPGAASAMCLAADGKREWKNKKQIKAQRDATCLDVMEYLQGNIVSMYDALGSGTGVAQQMASAINETEPERYARLQQRIQNVKESIGSSLLPTVNDFLGVGERVLTKVSDPEPDEDDPRHQI